MRAGNAFIHAYMGYILTKGFGAEKSKAFMDAHEVGNRGGLVSRTRRDLAHLRRDVYIDLYNNRIGRELAEASGSDDIPEEVILKALRDGKLKLP